MTLPPWKFFYAAAILILACVQTCTSNTNECPIGFNIAYTKHRRDNPICYKLKGPEPFADKFINCAGNLFTAKLYHTLNITQTNVQLWTDYKTLYPGGPFIDWSYTESTGDRLEGIRSFPYEAGVDYDESCLIVDPVANYTSTNCYETHHRYCFVKPYRKEDDMDSDGCQNFLRFWSPMPTCLKDFLVPYNTIKANWRSTRSMCMDKDAFLLNKGWRYANYYAFGNAQINPVFPLGIVMNPDNNSLRYDTHREDDLIPPSDWHFEVANVSSHVTSYGAIYEGFWHLVNSSYKFNQVICERTVDLININMTVFVDQEGKLILHVSPLNVSLDDDDFKCYTDSKTYYPTKIKARYDNNNNNYVLTPKTDGYYWCVILNSKEYNVTESNKALFIREKQSLVNHYAVVIHLNTSINTTAKDLEDYVELWQITLAEYVFYRTKYVRVFGELELEPATSEVVLKQFKASHLTLRYKQDELIHKMRVKRMIGRDTVLLHVEFGPDVMPASPGTWNALNVTYMKPVYYCKGLDSVPMLPLGASTTSPGCRTYTCVGDFNEGVQWVTTAASGCTITQPKPLNTFVQITSEVNLYMPTANTIGYTTRDWPSYATDQYSDTPEDAIDRHPPLPSPDPEEYESSGSYEDQIDPGWTTTIDPDWTTTPDFTDVITVTGDYSSTTVMETPTTVQTPCTTELMPTLPTPDASTTPLPPDEQLRQVLEDLELLLQNETIEVADITDTFDQVDQILELNDDTLEFPSNFLHLLDELGSRVNLNGSSAASTIRGNIALVMADAEPEHPVRGLRIAARDEDIFTESSFHILNEEINSTHLMTDENEAVVQLPESVASSTRRISFVVFRTDRAFRNEEGLYYVNSRVLSINVDDLLHFDDGEYIDIHLTPISEDIERDRSRSCAYWHFGQDDTGDWSQEGCTFIRGRRAGVLDTCRCDHLTHFAEVLIPRAVFSERNEAALEILTIIGCCLSIFGLCMVGITAALFRSWRRDYSNKIWLQLCIAIFILVLCFLIIVFLHFDRYNIPCMLLGVALHYSVLASFCWMLVAAILSYRRLVIVFARDASHKLLKASAFAWGVPCVVVGILLSVDPRSYAGQFEDKTPTGAFCYPSGLGLWLTVYAPISVMLVANWTLFALIVRSVFASKRITRHGDQNEALRCASVSCLLVFLFGLPWVFGLFAQNIVLAYLFTLTATYQGFVLFIFFVLGNKKTRDLWFNKLKIVQSRRVPVTSSTYTNRSTGTAPGARGNPEGASTIETNSSKPKSLTSRDNSRFS